jgi:hypothetical protein
MGDQISENGEKEKLDHSEVPEIVSRMGTPLSIKAGFFGAISFAIVDYITSGGWLFLLVGLISASICWFAYFWGVLAGEEFSIEVAAWKIQEAKEQQKQQQWLQSEEYAQQVAEEISKSNSEYWAVTKIWTTFCLVMLFLIFAVM